MHDVTQQNVEARNEHFVCAFVDVNVVSGRCLIFQADAILYEIQRTKYDYLVTFPAFSVRLSTGIG